LTKKLSTEIGIEYLRRKRKSVINIISIHKLMEPKMIMKNYVADELANKVFHLHKALNQAENIISVLEEENQKLKNLLFPNDNTENKDTVKIQCVA
jgi:hypothetical protein